MVTQSTLQVSQPLSYYMTMLCKSILLMFHVINTGMPKEITKAKIACLDFSLQKAKMHLGVSVVIDDPEKLEAIRKRYSESLNEKNNRVEMTNFALP